ncbi:DUF2285 domain-containing protein [Bradyrhizobium sp. DASA03076]|uniref:DUF2285 domain-containing protein n=1 Tax=Bradyrhizobium sp. BLXBL-03 TaxID=3395916 RepID=UPI003F6F5CC9
MADVAPSDPTSLTPYDQRHAAIYLVLLDADTYGVDWREATQILLHIDAEQEPARAWQAYQSHLARARWVSEFGYRLLAKHGWANLQ